MGERERERETEREGGIEKDVRHTLLCMAMRTPMSDAVAGSKGRATTGSELA
jgi:hypothetical protein